MASEPHSGPSSNTSAGAADVHIAPWASKWDALPEPVEATPPAAVRADAAKTPPAPPAPRPAKAEAAQGLFASRLMAGISALSFALLLLLAVVCWPDIARLVG